MFLARFDFSRLQYIADVSMHHTSHEYVDLKKINKIYFSPHKDEVEKLNDHLKYPFAAIISWDGHDYYGWRILKVDSLEAAMKHLMKNIFEREIYWGNIWQINQKMEKYKER